jgi:hypothetical protein
MPARPYEQFAAQRFDRAKHPRIKSALEKLTTTERRTAERKAEIRGDRDHSAEWKTKELQTLAIDTIKAVTKDGAHAVKRLQRDLDATRPKPPRLDKGDIVGALEDWEGRDMIRAMAPADRISFVSNLNADSRIVAAVIRSTPELIGVPAEVHSRVVDRVMSANFAAEYQFIAETAEDIEIAEAALGLVMTEARNAASAMEDHDWRSLVNQTIAPLNAELAKELAKPVQTAAIDVQGLVERAKTAPLADRRSLVNRLSEDLTRDEGAELQRQLDALRGV